MLTVASSCTPPPLACWPSLQESLSAKTAKSFFLKAAHSPSCWGSHSATAPGELLLLWGILNYRDPVGGPPHPLNFPMCWRSEHPSTAGTLFTELSPQALQGLFFFPPSVFTDGRGEIPRRERVEAAPAGLDRSGQGLGADLAFLRETWLCRLLWDSASVSPLSSGGCSETHSLFSSVICCPQCRVNQR